MITMRAPTLSPELQNAVKAISYTHALRILNALLDFQTLSFSELREHLELGSRALQNALIKLRNAALIIRRFQFRENDKRRSYYKLSTLAIQLLHAILTIENPSYRIIPDLEDLAYQPPLVPRTN